MAVPDGAAGEVAEQADTTTRPISSANPTPDGKQPPLESSHHLWTRRSIIFSFWAIALILGLPLWITTTSVYRAALPLEQMTAWADGKVR